MYINSLYEKTPDNSKTYSLKVYGEKDVTYKVIIDLAGTNTIDIDYEYGTNENSVTITFLETANQNGYSLEVVKTSADFSEKASIIFNMIQNSEIVGKVEMTTDLENSRKFIYIKK